MVSKTVGLRSGSRSVRISAAEGPGNASNRDERHAPALARILAVDDQRANLLSLEAALAPLGHDVITTSSGEEALRALTSCEFAVILLDCQMPGLDGVRTAQLIKERPNSREIPIILISSAGDAAKSPFGDDVHGHIDYLQKPFDEVTLRSKVAVFIELFLQRKKIKLQESELLAYEREAQKRREDEMRHEDARNRLLAQERVAREEAQTANLMRDEFLATVSHELRTPLTAILGWARILRTGTLDPGRLARALDVIERNGRAQAAIIDDILDVSRIITGKLRLELDALDLSAIVKAAIDTVRPAADARGIALEWKSELPERRYSGDPDRLQQIVWNLVSNAIKFTPKGGRVEVKAQHIDSHLEIRVSDTGQGIAPEFLPHVFDRFRQGDGTSTRRHGGLGLGLALVRHLVELHGGTVSVTSPGEGRGSTFVVVLPVRAVQVEPRQGPVADPSTLADPLQALADLLVLVVDDESDARELVTTVLEQAGARTVAVSTAAEALEAMTLYHPDVLLSDIGMPGTDGYSLMRQVRERSPEQGSQIPALALTAYFQPEDARRAHEAGFQRHVSKPVQPEVLVAQIALLAQTACKASGP